MNRKTHLLLLLLQEELFQSLLVFQVLTILQQSVQGPVLNGIVQGELGKVRIESILAGGYNIQKLHIRVLVKSI